jgi:hypothetical protein
VSPQADDQALATARALVATVCACGHLQKRHKVNSFGKICCHGTPNLVENCRCTEFCPVAFTVERKADAND